MHVYEKNADVGGTWLENSYPGCRVDVPNHLYSYSFAQSPHWPQFNSTQPVLLDYFRSCVAEFDLEDAISYQHEVEEAVWDDERSIWSLRIRDAAGAVSVSEVNAVVSAVGQLNRPSFPDIPGIDSFEGQSFHSARWDDTIAFEGKRVGVIGSGASAVQFIPWLADRAAHLTVYQRTPAWLVPIANYHDELPSNLRWILRHVPEYARWDRLALFSRLQEGPPAADRGRPGLGSRIGFGERGKRRDSTGADELLRVRLSGRRLAGQGAAGLPLRGQTDGGRQWRLLERAPGSPT